jgi:hypothetical protein
MSSAIDPAVLLDPDNPTPSIPAQTAMQGRLAPREGARLGAGHPPGGYLGGYEQEESCSSAITDIKVEGGNLVLTLARPTVSDKATDPKNYQVMVNGSTFLPQSDDIIYDPRSRSVTFRRLPLHPGDHVRVTVLGLWDANPYIPAPSVTCHMQIPKRRRVLGFSVFLALLLGVIVVVAYVAR